MSAERPDFTVDSKGNAKVERVASAVASLDLPQLFNAAGRVGSRDSEAFADELAQLLVDCRDEGRLALTSEDLLGSSAGIVKRQVEPLLAREGVNWQVVERALRKALWN